MPNSGFTLLEILIAISIIALIGIVAIPNLRRYNNLQIVKNSASEFKNTLKNAQSRANSNVKCSDTKSSVAWKVTIRNVVPPAYDLKGVCEDGSTVTHLDTAFPSELTISSASCAEYPIELTFTKNNFSYTCNTQQPSPGQIFLLTITNSLDNTQKTTVRVGFGGVVGEI